MNTRALTLIIAGMLASASSVTVPAVEKLRVLDKGIDGNQRTYLVTCPDGSLSSVVQTFDIQVQSRDEEVPPEPDVPTSRTTRRSGTPPVRQVCIYPREGGDICRPSWDVDAAAQTSCR